MQYIGSVEYLNKRVKKTVLLEETGQKISFLQAYPYCGKLLQGLLLYNYISIIKLKWKSKAKAIQKEVKFDNT